MTPLKDKKSVCYIRVDREVVTAEYYAIKHNNRTDAEKLAIKGKVKPFHTAQVSNHRKLKHTIEIPEDVLTLEPIDGEAADG